MGRVLALDVGDRRIGVAISDPLGMLARGLTTLERQSIGQTIMTIKALIQEYQPDMIVVGLPGNMDGTLGPQAEKVLAFTRELERAIPLPLVLWDEQLSTVSASEILSQQGVRTRNQKQRIDAVAAAVILQDYLNSQRPASTEPDLIPPDPTPQDHIRPARRRRDRRSKRQDDEDWT